MGNGQVPAACIKKRVAIFDNKPEALDHAKKYGAKHGTKMRVCRVPLITFLNSAFPFFAPFAKLFGNPDIFTIVKK